MEKQPNYVQEKVAVLAEQHEAGHLKTFGPRYKHVYHTGMHSVDNKSTHLAALRNA